MQRVLVIRESALGTEHPDVAKTVNYLGIIYRDKGDYEKAEQFYQRARLIWERSLGPNHPDSAAAINNLSDLYLIKGEYEKAERLGQQAVDIWENTIGPEHHRYAIALSNLADLYRQKGDFAKAAQVYQRILSIREATLGPNHRMVGRALGDLADVYRDAGDLFKAEPLYHRAVSMAEKTLGPSHYDVAYPLNGLGIIYRDKGNYVEAESLLRRALQIRETALGLIHTDVAASLNELAVLEGKKGNYDEAERFYRQALDISEKVLGPMHPVMAQLLTRLSILQEAQGKINNAISNQVRANTINERNIGIHIAAGSERQKRAYLATLSGGSDRTLSLHTRSAQIDRVALNMALSVVLQRKGRTLEAMTNLFTQLRSRANGDDQILFNQLANTVSQLAKLIYGGQEIKNNVTYRSQINQLEEQREKIEAELSRRSAEFREQIKPITLEAVQSAIPKDSALVEIASFSPVAFKIDKSEKPRYVVYILFPQGEPRWVDLGKAEAIDHDVAEFRRSLHRSTSANVKALARRLDQKVMRPIRQLLGPTRNVLLSPDGALNLVPFAALVDEQNRYLVERYSFTYLTSGRDLLRFRPEGQMAKAPVIVADPDFGERPADRKAASSTGILDLTEAYFPPLAATAQEARALKAILPQATVLTKDQATETALKQIASPNVLHIATHGFFLADKPEDAAETERQRKLLQQTGDLASLGGRLENPLLRSGLGLAGANLRKSGDDDGILTAMEVAGLNLWGTKLVVLSACETGVGEVRTGEGVYGLRRALVLAGAETQVMSLWPVSDQGTRDLMIGYYKRLQAGEGRSEAMRQVQLRMLKDPRRRHPFYWASFIVSGEWANLDGKR
jgi:CHAT domain-containing protein/Flp pilus assembly protein TadD